MAGKVHMQKQRNGIIRLKRARNIIGISIEIDCILD